MHQDIPRLTLAQRELSRQRLARRGQMLFALGDCDELAHVQGALARIRDGGYGLCTECGEHIPWTRLDAFPAAPRCTHCEDTRAKKRPPAPATL